MQSNKISILKYLSQLEYLKFVLLLMQCLSRSLSLAHTCIHRRHTYRLALLHSSQHANRLAVILILVCEFNLGTNVTEMPGQEKIAFQWILDCEGLKFLIKMLQVNLAYYGKINLKLWKKSDSFHPNQLVVKQDFFFVCCSCRCSSRTCWQAKIRRSDWEKPMEC